MPLLLAGLGLAALAWRLSAGPIALPFLSERISRALGSADGSIAVSIGSTELAWDAGEQDLDLRLEDVRLEVDGRPRASFPVLALRLSAWALLQGEVMPTSIELERPELHLLVRADGSIDLSTHGDPSRITAATTATTPLPTPTGARAGEPDFTVPRSLERLRQVAIRGGSLTLTLPTDAPPFELVGLDLDLLRQAEAVSLRFEGTLLREEHRIPLTGDAHYRRDGGQGSVAVSFRELAPNLLADLLADTTASVKQSETGPAMLLEALRLPLSGSVRLALAGLAPHRVELDLTGGAGTIEPPGFAALPIEDLRLAVVVDLVLGQLGLIDLSARLGGPVLQVEATIGDLRGDASFAGTARLASLSLDSLARYWPADAAPEARSWVTTNLKDGRVRYARARLAGRLDDPTTGGVALDPPTGWLAFDGLSVRFLPAMPPAQKVAGRGAFSAAGWKLVVLDGQVDGIELRQARVRIAIPATGAAQLAVRASVAGPLERTVALLEREPVSLSRALGFAPQVGGGRATGRLDLELPLDGGAGRRSLTAIARVRDASVLHLVRGATLADTDLRVRLAHENLRLQGSATLADAPIRFDWREPLAAKNASPGSATRHVTLSGRLDDAARSALALDTKPVIEGPVGFQASWTQPSRGDGLLDLELDLEQASLDALVIALRKPAGAASQAKARLVLRDRALAAVESLSVETPTAAVAGNATFAPGAAEIRSLDLVTTLHRPGEASTEVRLEARPDGDQSTLSLRCDDASAWLEAADATSDWSGGRLRVDGTARLALGDFRFDGRLDVRDVTLDHSPLMARLISLTSLRGLENALRGKPIRFDQVASGLVIGKDAVEIRRGAASGSSLRILLDGTIDRRADTADLQGTLVPSYYGINEAAKHIPVLGRILGGEDNALLTIDFSIAGPLADPKISVKPISSAAPGFLRDVVKRLQR